MNTILQFLSNYVLDNNKEDIELLTKKYEGYIIFPTSVEDKIIFRDSVLDLVLSMKSLGYNIDMSFEKPKYKTDLLVSFNKDIVGDVNYIFEDLGVDFDYQIDLMVKGY